MGALDIRDSEPDNGVLRCQHLMPMQQRFHCLILLILVFAFPAQAQRVVSLNYCYDQLLLDLSEELDQQSVKTLLLQEHGGRLERILRWQPDAVLANSFNSSYLLNRLSDHDITVHILPEPTNHQQAREFRKQFFAAVELDVTASNDAHSMLQSSAPGSESQSAAEQKTALLFQPNQYSWGRQSLFHELLEDAGLINLAAQQGEGLVRTSLEHILRWKPDLIILDSYTENFALAGLAQEHRSLSRLDAEIIVMPVDLSGCLGQRYTESLNWLMEQIP